jgi:hypothetical protein
MSIKVGANGFSLPRKIKPQTKHGYDSEKEIKCSHTLDFQPVCINVLNAV